MQVQLYVTWDNFRLKLPRHCAVLSSPLVSDSSKHIEGIPLVVRNIVGTYHDSIRCIIRALDVIQLQKLNPLPRGRGGGGVSILNFQIYKIRKWL